MNPILLEFPDAFETERLLIRAPRPGDGPELRAAIADSIEQLRPWMPWAKEIPTPEEAELNVRQAWVKFLSREDLRLHLFSKEAGIFVGCSGLHRINWDVPKFEIGYWCCTPFTRQGLIREAVEGITRFAFESLKAKRLEIRCDTKNVRSRNIPEALGFMLEGTLHGDAVSPSGALRNTLVFAKTSSG